MKQAKEIWNMIFNWLGNGKKVIMGIIFLLAGFVWNYFGYSSEGLAEIPFVIMLAGGLFLLNAIFSKATGTNINPLFFVLIFVSMMELGIVLMAGDAISNFTNVVMVVGACMIFVWALNYALLESGEIPGVVKKIVIAFFEMLSEAVLLVVLFVSLVWLATR